MVVVTVLVSGCPAGERCEPRVDTYCSDDITYWMDSCGKYGEIKENCACGCNATHADCEVCCTPQCENKCCGSDGCQGTCPDSCVVGETCNTTTCICEGGGCTDLDRRCAGSVVQECQGGEWQTLADCSDSGLTCSGGSCVCTSDAQCNSSQFCDNGTCRADLCPQGTRYCLTGDVYQCNANGSQQNFIQDCGMLVCQDGSCICTADSQCSAAQYCSAGACLNDVCSQGTTYCKNGDVYSCNVNGSSETLEHDCGVLSCMNGLCVCEQDSQCASAEHCSAGQCEADVCPQGTIYCVGNMVYQCDANGSAEVLIQDCGSQACQSAQCTCTTDAQCGPNQHCIGGVCVADVCVANTVYCQDGDVYQCNATGSAESKIEECGTLVCSDAACICTDDSHCQASEFCGPSGGCLADVCTADDIYCKAGDVYQCNSNGSGDTLLVECGAMVCDSSACVCQDDAHCAAAEYCDAGSCAADVCTQGTVFCIGDDVYQCNANGSSSSLVQSCGTLVCQDGDCVCTDDNQCGPTEHCSAGVCVENLCPPDAVYCKGDEVWQCNTEGTAENLVADCTPLVCADGACICTDHAQCAAGEHCAQETCTADVCTQGQQFCSGGDIYLCDAVGSGSTLVEDCGLLDCVGAQCQCTSDGQCSGLQVCVAGECQMTASFGMHTSDLDVVLNTDCSDLDTHAVAVSGTGQIAFLLAPFRYGAINAFDSDVMHLSSVGEISTFVTHQAVETHMGKTISELEEAVYDSNGDLIVADYAQSYDVLRIEPDGTINTLYLGADLVTLMGLGSKYDIGYPIFIDVDASNNVYYYAANPMQLIKITPAGTATVLATLGPDTEGRSMAAASNGTTYLYDSGSSDRYILRISATGTVTSWLSGDDIRNQVGGISPYITRMDVDPSGNLWAYDTNNNSVLRITSTGTATVAVSASTIDPLTTDPVTGVTFASPTGFVREPGGTLLVSFYETDNILRLNPSNDTGVEILSNEDQVAYLGKGGASFRCMQAVSGSRVYAFNAHSKELLQLDGGLAITSLATSDDFEAADTGVPQMTNFYPAAMTIDDSGLLYLADDDVMAYNPANGAITHMVHDTALEAATGNSYTDIRALAVADAGEIYIYDMASDSILKVDNTGIVSTLTSLPASSHVPYMVLGENDAVLYATETYSDDLKAIDTTTGVMSTFVSKAQFQAVTGSAFTAWSLAKLPSGNLVLFDEMWTASDNPERIVEVDHTTGSVSILVDQADIRAAAGTTDQVYCRHLSVDPNGVVYGFDSLGFDLLFWSTQ